MTKIETQQECDIILARIEELLPLTWGDNANENSPEQVELNLLANLVADYEDEHVVIESPTLGEVIKLRLGEMDITQKEAAKLLGISTPHMSAIINGKSEPSLSLARVISQKLDILPSLVLGV